MRPGSNEADGGGGGGRGRGRVDRLKSRNAHVRSRRRSVRRERRRIMIECRGRWWWCECAWVGESMDHCLPPPRRAVTGFRWYEVQILESRSLSILEPQVRISQISQVSLITPLNPTLRRTALEMYYLLDTGKRNGIVLSSVELITTYNNRL